MIKKDKDENNLLIKRDRIITCRFKLEMFNKNNKEIEINKIEMKHRVLSVCTKRYDKYLMTLDK